MTAKARTMRSMMTRSMKEQGFKVHGRQRLVPPNGHKDSIRQLHATAVLHKRERARKGLLRHETRLLDRLATGEEVNPHTISPKLVEVTRHSDDELLFRYAALHWSVPVSPGYGRRLRFLVIDQQNDKLMGLFGLGDPVFNVGARDQWIGWDRETTKRRLRHVMDLFVLGAVPPYSFLLGGKLISLLATSDEVRKAFLQKYSGKRTLISEANQDGRLALLTTSSALGRSSIFNRLKYNERLAYIGVGTSKGYGEFQFTNGLYSAVSQYALKHLTPTAKHVAWGTGFRNRREVMRKFLIDIGLSEEWLNHGIQREIFVIPLANDSREFLRGEQDELEEFRQPLAQIFDYFRGRWLMPRSQWDHRYSQWDPEEWRLWGP